MKIWLITVGEPLPLKGDERLFRTGIFANHLVASNHDVTWWTSTFNHVGKQHVVASDQKKQLAENFRLILLKGCGYKKNISLSRLRDHCILGRKFALLSKYEKKPDIILCSFPTIELSVKAVTYGKKHNVPVVLDVRDWWPEIFLDAVPRHLKLVGKLFLLPYYSLTRKAFREAAAVTGVTRSFVEWGVTKANRKLNALDQSFPMGYPGKKIKTEAAKNGFTLCKGQEIDKNSFLIVFFGYFGQQFDLETVFQAATELQEYNIPAAFILCGSGDKYEYYQDIAKNLSNVILPGWIEHNEIYALMEIASVGLMPYKVKDSFIYSMPNKFIEYLSAGLPIISTLHGESGSLLEQKACGAIYRNAAELVEIIQHLFRERQELKRMADASKKLFDEQFDAFKVYNKMMHYLEEIVGEYQLEKK